MQKLNKFLSKKQIESLEKKRKLDDVDPEKRKKQKEDFESKKEIKRETEQLYQKQLKREKVKKNPIFLTEKQIKILRTQEEWINTVIQDNIEIEKQQKINDQKKIEKRIQDYHDKVELQKKLLGDVPPSNWTGQDYNGLSPFSPEVKCSMYMKRRNIDEVVTECFCKNSRHFFVGENKWKLKDRSKITWWTFPVTDKNNRLVPRPEYDNNYEPKYTFYGLCGGTSENYGKITSYWVELRNIGLKQWWFNPKKNCYMFKDNKFSLGSLTKMEYENNEKKKRSDRMTLVFFFREWMDRIEILFEYERGYFTTNRDDLDEEDNEFFKKKVRGYVENGELTQCLMEHPNLISEEEKWENYDWWYRQICDFSEKLERLDREPSLRKFISFDENLNIRLDIHGFYKLLKKDIENKLYNKNNFY